MLSAISAWGALSVSERGLSLDFHSLFNNSVKVENYVAFPSHSSNSSNFADSTQIKQSTLNSQSQQADKLERQHTHFKIVHKISELALSSEAMEFIAKNKNTKV